MRNLKKILALVLALVMSFSLMATANAFTDDEQITDTYETAVTVLDGLKVFQGYDDGSFQPQGAITRAEVAAIIYRIVTGDVTDAQVGIYADYNKFDDVKSTSWYAGYVNFCANAEYIKGYDARTFGPNDPVTGYQALAMILRALGYDKNGEFTGSSWQVQTAAVGENRGITKNIAAGTLGTAASREVVAEILFQAILVDKVNYTPAFGYQLDDTSIGWDTFELESIEGVVVANEYADLYSDSPLKTGRTEMIVDGDSYVIDYATTLEDLGENHAAYITEGKNVLAIAKTGNTVFETGAEADIKTDKKFENVTGLERGSAEEFINFDGGSEYKVSDWKLSYVLKFEAADDDALDRFLEDEGLDLDHTDFKASTSLFGSEYTREVTFNAGKAIPSADIGAMKYIFNEADEDDNDDFILGEVYVGTQSNEDISDDPDMSWKTFQNKYIDTDENAIEVEENENGNWLKVVDVDGDGVADYVMKTIYTVTGVEDIDKDGDITLSCDEESLDKTDALNRLDDEDDDIDVVAEDEVSEGDIVYYAVIDGNAYTYLADVVTAEIEKVNRNTLTATTTDGDEYVQSGVCEHTYWDEITSGVKNLEGDVNYELYLDKFGYLAAFTESVNNAGFVLITDGYYESARTDDIYAAMVWDGEDLVDTDITDGGDRFIVDNRDDNDWGNLRWFNGVNANYNETTGRWSNTDIQTIVAALSDDGTLTPVDDLYRYREDVVMIGLEPVEENIPDRGETIGYIYDTTRNSTAYNELRTDADGDAVEADVRGLSSTVYYFVYNTDDGTVVREYVGYANTPDLGDDADKIENIYAVASRASDAHDDDYYTAEIVVVEMEDGYNQIDREEIFLLDLPEVYSSVSKETATVIRADGTMQDVTIDLEKSNIREYDPADTKYVAPGLYYMWESADEADVYVIEWMTPADIAASDYLAGTVNKNTATGGEDWTSVDAYENNWYEITPGNYLVASYAGYEDSKRNTEDSSYYIVSYDLDSDGEYTLDLETSDWDDALTQDVRGQDSLNSVLIAYDDNDILYAISFRYEDASTDIDDVFTESIFAWSTPAAEEEFSWGDVSVTFGSEKLTAGTPKTFTTYTEAVEALGDADGFAATPAANLVNVAGMDGAVKAVDLDANKATETTYNYDIVVMTDDGQEVQHYSVVVPAAKTDNDLTDIDAIAKIDEDNDEVNLGNGELAALTESDLTVSDGATAKIDAKDKTITVTSEAGVDHVYNIVEGAFIYVNDEPQGFVANGQEFEMPDDADTYVSDNVVGTISAGDTFTMNSEKPGVIEFYGLYDLSVDSAYAQYVTILDSEGEEVDLTQPIAVGTELTFVWKADGVTTGDYGYGTEYHTCLNNDHDNAILDGSALPAEQPYSATFEMPAQDTTIYTHEA